MSEVQSQSSAPGLDATNPIRADVGNRSTKLLASLVRFICPVIEAITPTSSNLQIAQAERDAEAVRLSESVEGRELTRSLENFIEFVVKNRCKDAVAHTEEIPEVHSRKDSSIVQKQPLEPSVINMINHHVFNYLPIRLLAFDSDGSNIRLIERNTMVDFVIKHFQEQPSRIIEVWEIDSDAMERDIKKFIKYAILSHTWIRQLPGDILFQDWAARMLPENARGYSKLTKFCEIAARDHGVHFGWMDTTCINKESSTELDESIRSMFMWYRNANVCITYLSGTSEVDEMHNDAWFTRGWTLQELLANQNIVFYNRDWEKLVPSTAATIPLNDPAFIVDDKLPRCRLDHIPLAIQYQIFMGSSITSRELAIFYGLDLYSRHLAVPLCRILQLAARRRVTRQEDQIYSLMGLLQVQIPIAYGEGSRNALQRMFRELMISRTSFLDLFNHTNEMHIVPFSIQDYINHSSMVQNKLIPKDPLLYSHLGIYATFLVVPVFLEKRFKDNIPSEIVRNTFYWSGMVGIAADSDPDCYRYIVMDNSNYSANWISNLIINTGGLIPRNPPLLYMAIFSSQVNQERDIYRLSAGPSLGIPMLPDLFSDIGTQRDVKFSDVKPVTDLATYENNFWNEYGPKVIHLPYSGPNVEDGIYSFSGAEAEKLGIKVVGTYFL